MPEFVQTNTESKKQLKKITKTIQQRQAEDREDVLMLLDEPRFRRFIWRLFEHTQMFESIWDPNGSKMNYNSGRQDFGHWLWEILEDARPEAMLEILKERQHRKESSE